MDIPQEIKDGAKDGRCILFLGAMASAPSPPGSCFNYTDAPPSGNELSKRLAHECGYPDEDKTNLQRVSLYYQIKRGRDALVRAIEKEITRPEIEPSPALHMLAALPFSIVITTNYDHLFDIALSRANTRNGRPKQPNKVIYNPKLAAFPKKVPLDPTEERPILMKLHGDIDRPESIVVTEEDYVNFIQKMSDKDCHPMHLNLRSRLNDWPVLFIGYSLRDYNLRLLFRTMRWHLDSANFPLSYSVDPYPDDLIVSVWQHVEKPMVRFIEQDLWDFVPALYEFCIGKEYDEP
jgi:hypothetical protein